MQPKLLLLSCLFLFVIKLKAQEGCTDPKANNYNSAATINNGSCTYDAASVDLTNAKTLPSTLNENSGLVYTDGGLFTLNDGGNPHAFYRIKESDGTVLQTITITNATNIDWEDITADATYFYIGDFGNNANGNRTNLKIYRVKKEDITEASAVSVTADVINFSYQDQVIQSPVTNGADHTKFDCEAVFVKDNVLHLFTKDWLQGHTTHYTLEATPGTHNAIPVEEFNVQGLVTAADISTDNKITLIGYDLSFTNLFMWVLSDYKPGLYFGGNKRKFDLGKSINILDRSKDKGQIEGVCFVTDDEGYVSSERINRTISGILLNVPARLYSFTLSGLITLPVNLISFQGLYQDKSVKLSWQTASETNSSHFEIERSNNGKNFVQAGRLKASGNSMLPVNYRFEDKYPSPGTNYYRLKQFDLDGNFKIYNVIQVKAPVTLLNPKAYITYNGNNAIVLHYKSNLTPGVAYQIVSAGGAVISKGIIQNESQNINVRNITTGTYFLKLDNLKAIPFQKR